MVARSARPGESAFTPFTMVLWPTGFAGAQWERLTEWMIQNAPGGTTTDIDVFLCLFGDGAEVGFDRRYLEWLVGTARDHTIGGRLFVVVDRSSSLSLSPATASAPSAPLQWLETIWRVGLVDLLEAYVSEDPEKLLPRIDRAVARSNERSKALCIRDPGARWRCLVPLGGEAQVPLLEPYLATELSVHGEQWYLAVLPSRPVVNAERDLENILKVAPERTKMVVKMGDEPRSGLKAAERSLKIPVVSAVGHLELGLFIRRLNQGLTWRPRVEAHEVWTE